MSKSKKEPVKWEETNAGLPTGQRNEAGVAVIMRNIREASLSASELQDSINKGISLCGFPAGLPSKF
jgi:hypothetical protein